MIEEIPLRTNELVICICKTVCSAVRVAGISATASDIVSLALTDYGAEHACSTPMQ